jgi:phospholipase C
MKALLCSFLLLVSVSAFPQAPRFSHIVMVVQENRTPDNLFGSNPTFEPGVDIGTSGLNSKNQTVPITAGPFVGCYDLGHTHASFVKEYVGGKMNGFDKVPVHSSKGCALGTTGPAYRYVDNSTGSVQPYFDLAMQYGFANRMFQTNQGPSFPAHQFLVSGTSSLTDTNPLFAAENPHDGSKNAGCGAPPGSWVYTINSKGQYGTAFPCFQRSSIMDLLDAAKLTWRYYSPNPQVLWDAPAALTSYYQSTNVMLKPSQVLTDIKACNLADVVWVTPTGLASDHPSGSNGTGPAWVSSIVNAIGSNPACPNGEVYWKNTAILITWDDWGGWYDHVAPPPIPATGWGQSYVYGFRVPLLVVSAYTPAGYVDDATHDFGSMLRFAESNFGLSLIGTGYFADAYADDLSAFFTLSTPRKFVQIQAPKVNFAKQPLTDPDTD